MPRHYFCLRFNVLIQSGLLAFLSACLCLSAQNVPVDSDRHGPDLQNEEVGTIPIMSGGAGMTIKRDSGVSAFNPVIAPLILLPIGERWLVEGRGEFEGDFRRKASGDLGGAVNNQLQFLQIDYIAGKYATLTAGRFLIPFGIFNERLYPIWIRNFQFEPLIFPLATGSGTGAMVRGGFEASKGLEINYASYFSEASTVRKLDSTRSAGGRFGLFLPAYRLEIGASAEHSLQDRRANSYGLHMAWQPTVAPLDLRGEYAYADNGEGYWLEAACRLSWFPLARHLVRHTQAVVRAQQFFLGKNGAGEPGSELPLAKTRQVDYGVNYYFRDDVRLQSSYGRSFSKLGDRNLWTIGMTYRFAFPLGLGGGR